MPKIKFEGANFLLELKKRLYIYVAIDFALAIIAGYLFDFRKMNIKPVIMAAVFIMLYPMLTGMEIERIKKRARILNL